MNLGYVVNKKRDDSNVASSVNYGSASVSSWSKFVGNPEIGIMRIRGSSKV